MPPIRPPIRPLRKLPRAPPLGRRRPAALRPARSGRAGRRPAAAGRRTGARGGPARGRRARPAGLAAAGRRCTGRDARLGGARRVGARRARAGWTCIGRPGAGRGRARGPRPGWAHAGSGRPRATRVCRTRAGRLGDPRPGARMGVGRACGAVGGPAARAAAGRARGAGRGRAALRRRLRIGRPSALVARHRNLSPVIFVTDCRACRSARAGHRPSIFVRRLQAAPGATQPPGEELRAPPATPGDGSARRPRR